MADKIARAIEAQRVLDSELTKEAFAVLEEKYVKAWRYGTTVDIRENAHRHLMTLDSFKAHFRSVVTTGDLEAKEQKALDGKKGWPFAR